MLDEGRDCGPRPWRKVDAGAGKAELRQSLGSCSGPGPILRKQGAAPRAVVVAASDTAETKEWDQSPKRPFRDLRSIDASTDAAYVRGQHVQAEVAVEGARGKVVHAIRS